MPLATRLSPVDLGIVALYLVAITLFGLRFAKSSKQDKSLKSYFLADNAIPWWAIALSIVSAETSTLTIISIPGVAFAGNLGFLQIVLGYMLGRIVVAFLFLPRYFRGEMLTAYQLIDRRFGHTLHKITAGLFLLTRAAAEGVRVFAISIVVSIAIGTGDTASIAIISALTLLYTFEGGMRAVIWTDVAQMILYLAGTLAAILTLGHNTPGGWSHIHAVAAPLGKFQVLNFSLNLTTSYTFWAGILGGTFLTMASHGTDQLMVQRMLAARNLRASRLALLSSGAVIFLQFTLFLLIGVGLFVFYSTHPAVFKTNDYIFPTYIVREMPHGISGLLIAAILAAAMSNLSAALNSLASTTVIDFYLPFMGRHKPNAVILSEAKDPRSSPGSTENSTLISRAATIVWALILFLIAVYSIHAGGKGHVVETGLSIASVAYGCLLGVFLLGTLTKYATQTGAILGMISGFLTNLFLYQATFPHPLIPLSLHIAFTWYVLIGAIATFLIGSLFSVILPKPRRATITALLLLPFLLSFRSEAQESAFVPKVEAWGFSPMKSAPEKIGASAPAIPPQPTYNSQPTTQNSPYDFTPVSTLITTAIADHKLPGAVVLIGHNGQVVFQQAYGLRKLAGEPGLDGQPSAAEPMTLDTIFDMASLTKVIVTTTAILQLYEQGKLSLDAPVAKYLPEFANPATTPGDPSFASSAKGGLSSEARPPSAVPSPKPVILNEPSSSSPPLKPVIQNEPSSSSPPLKPVILSGAIAPSAIAQSKDPDTARTTSTARPFSTTNPPSPAAAWKSQITIRQLLTHYSGLPEDVSLKDDWGLKSPDKAEGIRRAMASIPYGPPGVTFKYSDINFITLGYLVEKLSGQDLDVYARNQIFNPLGMNDTSYLPIAEACGDGLSVPPYSWGTQRGPRKSNAIWECLVPPQAKQPWNASNLVFRIAPTAHDDESKTNPTANPYFDTLLRGTVHDPTTRRMGGVAGHAGLFSTAADMSLFCQALLDKLTKNTGPFPLKQSTLQLATSPQAPATAATNATIFTPNGQTTTGIAQRGLGWDLNTAFSRPRGEIFPITTKEHPGSFGHTGFTGTGLWLDPTSDTYVILLANAIHPRGNATISPLRGAVATAAARALGLGPATTPGGPSFAPLAKGGLSSEARPSSSEPPQPPSAPFIAHSAMSGITGPPPITPRTDAERSAAQKALKLALHNHPYKTWIDEEPTLTGIDVLEQSHFAALKSMAKGLKGSGHGLRIALLTNQSGLDSQGRRTIDILLHANPQIKLVKLFTPEHGLLVKQDTENLKAETDPTTRLPVISLYGAKPADRHPKPVDLKDIDAVVIDLQDMGVRFWTYETVLGYFLEPDSCGHPHPAIVVLDRPNPIGGLAVQGNVSSTINYNAYTALPVRHGLTYGELARYFNSLPGEAGKLFSCLNSASDGDPNLRVRLTVIPMQNWHRADFFADTHLPFTPPSPNMKTLNATILYPGVGLIDQTNISVGRGTDTPYENIGLPWVTSPNAQELADYLTARHIPGITFTPTTLTIAETPEKYPGHGQTIPGIHFTITDRIALDTPELGIELLSALHHLYPTQFQLDKVATLLANPETLAALKSGTDPRTIAATWLPALQKFRTDTAPYLLYH